MEPKYQDNHVTVWNKSCTDMAELADESVQCCITSPPYYGLRKYSGEQDLIWGGENHHEHSWATERTVRGNGAGGVSNKTMLERKGVENFQQFTDYKDRATYSDTCSICGAWRGAFGLEPSPELYVSHLIEILREIRRVLRKDGTLFLNLGDSYAENRSYQVPDGKWVDVGNNHASKVPDGLKPKDLCLIPFRVALAAQADGWWVRSVIIWSKNNPMPESVKDRPTESHEYILMLTKSAKYYWDQEAVREPYTEPMNRWGGPCLKQDTSKTSEYKEMQHIGCSSAFRVGRPMRPNEAGRNLRSVWTFPTQPYSGAHFAVYPEELPERCIKAGTSEYGCCGKCGRPYERIVESEKYLEPRRNGHLGLGPKTEGLQPIENTGLHHIIESKTLGWKQACACAESKPVPSVVLDPFAGSGTTLWVAKRLNRKAVGYELSSEYCELIKDRNRQQILC